MPSRSFAPHGLRLTLRSWNNTVAQAHTPQDAVAAPYCCPTPPESPEACRAGPVKSTKYVEVGLQGAGIGPEVL